MSISKDQLKRWAESQIKGIKWNGNEGLGHSPFRDDKHPSFSFNIDKGIWYDHATKESGGVKDFCDKLNISYPWKATGKPTGHHNRKTVYQYTDEGGNVLYEAVRTDTEDGKKFFYRHRNGKGYINNIKGKRRVLYRLPGLLEALKNGKTVYIGEGEKLTDLLVSLGLPTTTNPMGAGKWEEKYSDVFSQGDKVVIFPDSDNPGQKHAHKIAESLHTRGCEVKVIDLGYKITNSHGKDIYDWFKTDGHNKQELLDIIDRTPTWNIEQLRKILPAGKKAGSRGQIKKEKIIPGVIAETFCEKYHPMTVNEKLYFYKDGVYKPDGETLPAEIQAKLGAKLTTTYLKNEIFNYVKDKRIIKKELVNSKTEELNLINGILDLDTGELKKHSKENYSTIRIPIEYNPKASCPKFLKFLEEVAQPEDIPLLQEFMGYCLIPTAKFKKAVMLTGTKDTGKSVFLEVIQRFVGWENISFIPLQELTDSRFMKAEIYGKLVNMFADLSPFSVKDSKIFMTVTSGDPIVGERKGQDPFTFRPFSKLIFSANKIPKSHNKTVAYIERWEYIHFGNVIPEEKKDRDLIKKLTSPEELSGILIWAIEGLSRLYEQNCFTTSKNSQKMKAEWRKYNDTVHSFIKDECVLGNELSVGKQLLYDNFYEYCKSNGVKSMSQIAFNRKLIAFFEERIVVHILKEIRPTGNERKWQGISLCQEEKSVFFP